MTDIAIMHRTRYIATVCLALGILFATSAMSSLAQTYTLTIRDGNVYVNGKMLESDQVPASLDPRSMDLEWTVSGTSSPTFLLGDYYYRIEDQKLKEVRRAGNSDNETTVVFRNNAPARSAAGARYDNADSAQKKAKQAEDPNSMMQQYVYELSENMRQLNEMSPSLSQRQARDLIQQVHTQAEEAARFAQELPYLEMQQYMVDIGQRDQALYQRLLSELELEQETRRLASEAIALPQGEARDLKIAELRDMLGHILDLKQENRQREIDQLDQQLSLLKSRLAEREAMKEAMIERRIQELLGGTQ